ncbi:MAG: 2-succinyl-5-enolpyruvyl-6-hydroxy-3-cyclohexene-1-carboxylic-acid synthase [Chloroflexota bacterium]|nr:2-succinyl-5-enolpyruvyl-6-hydroxy-3-cyclohexene-1-carboxylic-acid synthase [Chloroflexota bacterium]
MPNANTLYANVFVDALVAAGLKRVCFLPGSRHTPLILAFARHRDAIDISSHLDERSAAFFALGLATASNEAAALVCTSGSAAANFFPAIIEARQSRAPLLVLSADRPPELRHSGANQTIDQVKLYGDAVAWFVDAPLPQADPSALALRNLRTLAARAMHKTAGGVVHINLPFRKPFEPGEDDAEAMNIDRGQATRFSRENRSDIAALDNLMRGEIRGKRGIIYFGHGSCRTAAEARALTRWAARAARLSGYPILAEYTSNMRNTGLAADERYEPLGAYETYISAAACEFKSIEVLIRFGRPPLSKAMSDLVAGADLKHHIYCSRDGEWADDSHSITDLLHFDPLCAAPMPEAQDPPATAETAFRDRIGRAEKIAWKVIDKELETGDYFDGAVVYDVADLMPAGGLIFAGNSLPARHLDQFGKPGDRPMLAFANRGASGIDGNISTALGIGAAYRDRPLAAIVGDITFYHDMNGLLAIRRCGLPATIVVLNNGGGGIFHRLPIRRFEPAFSDYFITAHGLDFSHAARLYGLDYRRADDRPAFRRAFSEAVAGRGSTLIEVRTDALNDLRRRAGIMATIRAEVEEMDA